MSGWQFASRRRDGPDIGFVLVAGLVARRIVCALYEGQLVATGQRVGLIRFGSRVDVYCPPPDVPLVVRGAAHDRRRDRARRPARRRSRRAGIAQ